MNWWKLAEICRRQQWFTNGDIEQYQRLFDKARAGASLETLALIIWICSSNATEEEILQILKKEVENEL